MTSNTSQHDVLLILSSDIHSKSLFSYKKNFIVTFYVPF